MNTVFTPAALNRSVQSGYYRKIKLKDAAEVGKQVGFDEMFLFIFPSPNAINEINGDGDFLEIEDYKTNLTEVYTSRGSHRTTGETEVYVR